MALSNITRIGNPQKEVGQRSNFSMCKKVDIRLQQEKGQISLSEIQSQFFLITFTFIWLYSLCYTQNGARYYGSLMSISQLG